MAVRRGGSEATTKPTLYLETSVVSYLVARPSSHIQVIAHQQLTHDRWNDRRHAFAINVSEVVLLEAGRGDPELAKRRLEIVAPFPVLKLSPRVAELTATYLSELKIPERAARDAAHLAFAAAYRIDYLLTWNCRHIAHTEVRRRLRESNARLRAWTPVICTPEELVDVR